MIYHGRAESMLLADETMDCCVTSPPYWGLRDYGIDGQLGLEKTPDEYVARMVAVFREVWRVLKPEGTLWLNLGDSYAGSRAGAQGKTGQMADRSVAAARCRVRAKTMPSSLTPKNLVGIPWRVAFALQADGWILRSDIIWAKPNPMPESVRDRPTKSHEYLFMLAKSPKYYWDQDAVKEAAGGLTGGGFSKNTHDARRGVASGGDLSDVSGQSWSTRNIRTVWSIATQPFPGAHFAVMPPRLVEPCIKAGCPEGGTVLDPFAGAGTVGMVAARLRRQFIGFDINPAFVELGNSRIRDDCPLFPGGEGDV